MQRVVEKGEQLAEHHQNRYTHNNLGDDDGNVKRDLRKSPEPEVISLESKSGHRADYRRDNGGSKRDRQSVAGRIQNFRVFGKLAKPVERSAWALDHVSVHQQERAEFGNNACEQRADPGSVERENHQYSNGRIQKEKHQDCGGDNPWRTAMWIHATISSPNPNLWV